MAPPAESQIAAGVHLGEKAHPVDEDNRRIDLLSQRAQAFRRDAGTLPQGLDGRDIGRVEIVGRDDHLPLLRHGAKGFPRGDQAFDVGLVGAARNQTARATGTWNPINRRCGSVLGALDDPVVLRVACDNQVVFRQIVGGFEKIAIRVGDAKNLCRKTSGARRVPSV